MSPYKIISLLLQYPDARLLAARDQIAGAVAELKPSRQRRAIQRFLDHWLSALPTKLQEEYVRTFDFRRQSTLYLSYHIHGDRRQRGTALLQLKEQYASAGLPLTSDELPDYLPTILEFVALAPRSNGLHVLNEFRTAIELVRANLKRQKSPYVNLLDAICLTLPRLSVDQRASIKRLAAGGPPMEQVGLGATPEMGCPVPPIEQVGPGSHTEQVRAEQPLPCLINSPNPSSNASKELIQTTGATG